MRKFFISTFACVFLFGLFGSLNASVTASNNPLDEKEDIRDLRQDARKLLKKPEPFKPPKRSTDQLDNDFNLPDYGRRVRKDPVIRQMKKSLNRFNNNPDSDQAMKHLGEPGTFVWLQGRQPIYVFGPDCFGRIIRENKEENEVSHIGFFGKFLKRLRRRFTNNKRRFIHSKKSRILLDKRIKHTSRVLEANKQRLKARILQENMKRVKSSQKRKQKDAILDFLHLKPKRKLVGIPAQTKATIDDSYIHVTSFARPPLQQSSLVRNPADNSTNIIQMRIKIPKKNYQVKKKSYV